MTRFMAAALVLSLLAPGCVGQQVRGQADGIEAIIKNARKNGAYKCAPKELAYAEAYLERTRDELDLGNYIQATDHITTADTNARLAFKKSPPEKCAPKVVMPAPRISVKRVDTDGDGCYDDVDKCPKEPEDKDGFQDEDCCPDPDNDQDGIPDTSDKCPNVAEDKDGFQDEDGCPDNDNDQDGIADVDDKCPLQPEDYDGDSDDDGCPDKYKLVVVTAKKIELKQKVFFATAKTRILARSYQLLNEVAKALKDMPKIEIRIEGHTDSRGRNRYNQRLSDGRANSVRTYLIQRGVDASRMRAVGYGEDKPVASNRTRAGRAMNRRVEFMITKQ